MSEFVNAPLENAEIPTWQVGLSAAINETYSYANNSLFYALAPSYYRDYLTKYVKVALQWIDGYVPYIHEPNSTGIISTRLATKLITGLTKQIVGEKIIFKLNDRTAQTHETLHFVSEWADKQNIIKAIYSGIGYALGTGTSLLKANVSEFKDVWWEAVRFDNCFYTTNFKGEVKEATFMIRNYVDTREGHNNDQFYLVEHRFWHTYKAEIDSNTLEVIHAEGDKKPMQRFEVYHCKGSLYNKLNVPTKLGKRYKWQELPVKLQDNIKNDYSTIKLDEEQTLPFENLGVEALLNANIDLSVPTACFGESMIVGIQDDLLTYELASSYCIRDMYLGKGTVYKPKSLSMGDIIPEPILNTMPNTAVETINGVNPDEQKIVVNQFSLRAIEWQQIKENCLKNIAVKWGMSPKILSSFLASGQAQMTATQVDSEDDVSIAFIYHTRAYFKNALNRLLETTLNFYGKEVNVKLDFASPSLINKDRLLQRITNELQVGLIDIEEAIRTLNPDLDEEALQHKIDVALQKQQEMQLAQISEMNDDGTFGNDIMNDPDGSTAPKL